MTDEQEKLVYDTKRLIVKESNTLFSSDLRRQLASKAADLIGLIESQDDHIDLLNDRLNNPESAGLKLALRENAHLRKEVAQLKTALTKGA